ncbi:MAG: hypothetical protein QE164_06015 [Candidatus Nezhaarchaeota archaeon]|nr:hypothetical protein [Candidatus Nezhaarchaeota archaeon]
MSYVERKKRSVRSIRAQIKRTIRELKDALSEGTDTKEIEEELLRLAKSKRELSQRVRFRLS